MLEDNPGSSRPAEFVEALAKGLLILESFDAQHPEMTLSEVARRVGLSPAAARRGLLTLRAMGYVGQTGKRFHLRPKVMSLGSAFYFSARVDEVLQPELRRIVGTFGDASSVATLEGRDVLYIAHYSEQRARRPTAVVGARYPAHATSLGRVLLAGLPEADFDRYMCAVEPVKLTRMTVVDKNEIRAIVEEVREKGYATAVDQLDYGITALAVPIRGSSGRTIAALNSSGYSGVVTAEDLVARRLQELRLAAGRLSLTLSRYPVLESIIGMR
ncbi:MAG TPA: helix-turn-helix domain-containing protein [Rhizobiales bacterium]|nr:helix-turn-helix domain-containing protein [Hyphomicrobiales bacterium]